MPEFNISFLDVERVKPNRVITADYYKLENGWFTFKDNLHKVIYDLSAQVVQSIERIDIKDESNHKVIINVAKPITRTSAVKIAKSLESTSRIA